MVVDFIVGERAYRATVRCEIGNDGDFWDGARRQGAGGVAHGRAEGAAGADLVGFGLVLLAEVEHPVLAQGSTQGGGGFRVNGVAQL